MASPRPAPAPPADGPAARRARAARAPGLRPPRGRLLGALLGGSLAGATRIVRALPSRWVLALADRVGDAWYLIGARARRVGMENLAAVFGDAMDVPERRRVLRASLRATARGVGLLFHAAPLTPGRVARWVDVPDEVGSTFLAATEGGRRGGVLVSAHVGSWELLLGLSALFPRLPAARFLVESTRVPAFDRFVNALRGTAGGAAIVRRDGARAIAAHVRAGGVAALLADRNVTRRHGGIWVPFLGLLARTSPLPAWIAIRHDVRIRPVFCLPAAGGRYRIWLGPDLAEGVDRRDPEAAIVEVTARMNDVVGRIVRAHPEAWNWTLKRFKSRPDRALGAYPAYSRWDPDPEPVAAEASARP